MNPTQNHKLTRTSIFWMTFTVGGLCLIFLSTATLMAAQTDPEMQTQGAKTGLFAFLFTKAWSPYAAGVGIGILSWVTFLLSDHPLGISTAFAQSSGMIETAIRGEKARNRPYYQKFPPKIGWEWMLLVGLVAGAAFSAILSGDFALRFMPDMWVAQFGEGWFLRWFVAFIGGVIMGIGARWANGCTSGHALSGTMQLVVSSWIAAAGIFVGGILTAFLIF